MVLYSVQRALLLITVILGGDFLTDVSHFAKVKTQGKRHQRYYVGVFSGLLIVLRKTPMAKATVRSTKWRTTVISGTMHMLTSCCSHKLP